MIMTRECAAPWHKAWNFNNSVPDGQTEGHEGEISGHNKRNIKRLRAFFLTQRHYDGSTEKKELTSLINDSYA